MQNNEHFTWHYYPLNLTGDEINNPIKVIALFFDYDEPDGHLRTLRKWRKKVMSKGYFKGDLGGPNTLLHIYQLHIRLIEAIFLIVHRMRATGDFLSAAKVTARQIAAEKQQWDYYPMYLGSEKLIDPYKFLKGFCSIYDLPGYRSQLQEWLQYGLSVSACDEFIPAIDLVQVYENLQQLYEACWLIHLRASSREAGALLPTQAVKYTTDTIPNKITHHTMNLNHQNQAPSFVPGFSRLTNTVNEETVMLFTKIIAVIQRKLETATAIFFIGALHANEKALYFLVVTDDAERRNSTSLNSMIEESCRDLAEVTVFVHNACNVAGAVNGSNYFFNSILLHGKLLFLSGKLILPVPQALNYLLYLQKASKVWGIWHHVALDHIGGASFYMDKGNYRLAIFSLHQATECILKGLNRAITGYKIDVHNLPRLFTISTLYTDKLSQIFLNPDELCRKAFDLLKNAYTDARYKDDYAPDTNIVSLLYGNVVKLRAEAENIFLSHVSSMDSVI